jgi:hypothetical protein
MSYLSKFIITCFFFSLLLLSIILGVYQTFFLKKDEFYISSKILLKFNNEVPILYINKNDDYLLSQEFKPTEVLLRFYSELEFWKLSGLKLNETTEQCKLFGEKKKNTQFSITDEQKQIITIKITNLNINEANNCINQLKSLIKKTDEDIKKKIINELNARENYLFNKNSTVQENQIHYLKKISVYKEQVKKYSTLVDIKIWQSKELKTDDFMKFSPVILFLCFLFVLLLMLILQSKKNKMLLYEQVRKLI